MALASQSPASRRALLTAVLGGVGAAVATALGRPRAAAAADGGPLVIGTTTTASSTTILEMEGADDGLVVNALNGVQIAIWGQARYGVLGNANGFVNGVGTIGWGGLHGTGVSGISSTGLSEIVRADTGVHGFADGGGTAIGVNGESPEGTGAKGVSTTGIGVYGFSVSGYAVNAETDSGYGVNATSVSGTAVYAYNTATALGASVGVNAGGTGTGIFGFSGTGGLPAALPKTGVYGYAAQDSGSRGVVGQSTAGQGVRGLATTGIGLRGYATSGAALSVESSSGYAIQASGRVSLAKVSGVATIGAAATASNPIATGTDITTSSFVLLTPQADPGSRRIWATLDAAANTITIRTNASAASALKVAWLLLG